MAGLGESAGSFLEVWIRHFALELNRLLRTQYKQHYVEVEWRVGFLRGKLLTERELDGSAGLSARYACRFEVFTPDHLLNRTLKFCNSLLLGQTCSAGNRKILGENEILMAGVAFDMERLFEEFVAEFLKRNASEITLGENDRLTSVSVKEYVGRLFGQVRMEPDLILRTAGKNTLLDTRHKLLSPGERPSSEGLYRTYSSGRAQINLSATSSCSTRPELPLY